MQTSTVIVTLPPPASLWKRLVAACLDCILVVILVHLVIHKYLRPMHPEVWAQLQAFGEAFIKEGQLERFIIQLSSDPHLMEFLGSSRRMTFFIMWGYYAVNACLYQGGTLGKQICGLRVVRLQTLLPLNPMQGIARAWMSTFFLVNFWPFLMGLNLCYMGINKLHRGLHDRLCQSYVIGYKDFECIRVNSIQAVPSVANEDI